jgi:hypothetical protein
MHAFFSNVTQHSGDDYLIADLPELSRNRDLNHQCPLCLSFCLMFDPADLLN